MRSPRVQAWRASLTPPAVARAVAEGIACGVLLWCIGATLGVLAGASADSDGMVAFAVGAAALALLPRGRAVMRALIGAGIIIVVLVVQTPLMALVARRWVRADAVMPGTLQAVIAVSGRVTPDSAISSEGLDHLLTALELLRRQPRALLVTTRVETTFPGRGTIPSDIDQRRIVGMIAPNAPWLVAALGHSTRDEALHTAALLLRRGARRIAVVASPMHTRRACAAFEAQGFVVSCVPARMRTPGGRVPPPWPADRLSVFGDWMYELGALAKYRLSGWITHM